MGVGAPESTPSERFQVDFPMVSSPVRRETGREAPVADGGRVVLGRCRRLSFGLEVFLDEEATWWAYNA